MEGWRTAMDVGLGFIPRKISPENAQFKLFNLSTGLIRGIEGDIKGVTRDQSISEATRDRRIEILYGRIERIQNETLRRMELLDAIIYPEKGNDEIEETLSGLGGRDSPNLPMSVLAGKCLDELIEEMKRLEDE